MSEFKIRPFEESDTQAVMRLHNEALEAAGAHVGNGPWDRDLLNIEDAYVKNNGVFLVGILDGQLIAMGALRKISDTKAEIKRMRVSPQFQRKGLGQKMLDALENEAIKRYYKTLCLDTTVIQEAAQKMYLKNKYVEARRGKQGPFDTIFYEKQL